MSIPFHDALKKRLEALIGDRAAELAFSPSTGDDGYGDYRQRCGVIHGIQIAVEEGRMLEEKIMGAERTS